MVEGDTTEKTPLEKKKDELKIKKKELETKEKEFETAIENALRFAEIKKLSKDINKCKKKSNFLSIREKKLSIVVIKI